MLKLSVRPRTVILCIVLCAIVAEIPLFFLLTRRAATKNDAGGASVEKERDAIASNGERTATTIPVRPDQLRLPTPVIVMGLPKAGTTSIGAYFQCGFGPDLAHRVSHYDCHPKASVQIERQGAAMMSCGHRMYVNIVDKRENVFDGVDHFDVYSEIDYLLPKTIILPQFVRHFTRRVYDSYPNATWILNTRQPRDWLDSLEHADLRRRFVRNKDIVGENFVDTDENMIGVYNRQANFVRRFVRNHPSLRLVEVAIDKPSAGEVLENAFGIPRTCWGKKNPRASFG